MDWFLEIKWQFIKLSKSFKYLWDEHRVLLPAMR